MPPPKDTIKPSEKLVGVLNSFRGGMRLNDDPSNLDDSEYYIGINIRVRDGAVQPVKLPLNITSEIPAGKKQGLFGFNSILVLFCDGKAYARDYAVTPNAFNQISGFLLDANVDTIYAQDVPASWMNLQRKLDDGTDVTGGISFLSQIAGTPAALVCQDGINQPFLLFSIGNARRAKTEHEWTNNELTAEDTREYVPIGKQMMYHPDGILIIISPDGKEIYRSVTGRPLDFVIAVDTNGDKFPPLSSGKPEASRLSYNLDYSPITSIANINSVPRTDTESSGFFVSTLNRSWIVYPDYTQTPYNEPTFANQSIFQTGANNQFSVGAINGDAAIINESGPTTFNSIASTQTEGKNAPFYYSIARLFKGIVQDTTCIGYFDDYTLFGVNTIFGYGILVYDNLSTRFVSLDIYPEVSGRIKQFANVKVLGQKRLFFITTGDQLFEAFASTTTANWQIYTKELSADTEEGEIIPRRFRVNVANVKESGDIIVQEFVDRFAGTAKTKSYTANTSNITGPIAIPFGNATKDKITTKTYVSERPLKGSRVGLLISGSIDCELQEIKIIVESEEQIVADTEKGGIYANIRGNL